MGQALRPCVYLGGTLDGRPYEECRRERERAAALLRAYGIEVIDPLRGKESLQGQQISRDDNHQQWGGIAGIIARDKYDLSRSDLLLILTGDIPTDGTWLEYGYALYRLGIPVVLVAPSRIGKHGWSNHEAAYIAPDLEDAVRWIGEYYFSLPRPRAAFQPLPFSQKEVQSNAVSSQFLEEAFGRCFFCQEEVPWRELSIFNGHRICSSCLAQIPSRIQNCFIAGEEDETSDG